MTLKKNNRGFTLVELLVTMALLGLAIVAVGSFNFINQKTTYQNKLLNEQHDDMRFVINTIVPYIRMGSDIEYSNNTVTVVIPPDVASSNFTFGFNEAGGTIWIRDNSHPLCSNIAELNINTSNLPLVELELVSVPQMPGVKTGLPIRMKTSVLLRNR